MAGAPPPSEWVREGKLSSYWNTALPPAIVPFLHDIRLPHLQAIRNELNDQLSARVGTLGLPPSEAALCDIVSAALVARSYGVMWTKAKLTSVRELGFAPAAPFPPDFQTTPAQGLMIPKCAFIASSSFGVINHYALAVKTLPTLHLNNSVVPGPVHYRAEIEHDIIRFCEKVGIPLVPYAKDQTLDATNPSMNVAIDDHPIAAIAPPGLAYRYRTVYSYDVEMSLDDIVVASVWATHKLAALNAAQTAIYRHIAAPPPAVGPPPVLGDDRADYIIVSNYERDPKRRRLSVATWPKCVQACFLYTQPTMNPDPQADKDERNQDHTNQSDFKAPA